MKPASASSAARALPDFWLKLAAGVAATGLLAGAAHRWEAQALYAKLGRRIVPVLVAASIPDARVTWTSPAGWSRRVPRLSGTADAATRARVIAEITAQPGVHDTRWEAP